MISSPTRVLRYPPLMTKMAYRPRLCLQSPSADCGSMNLIFLQKSDLLFICSILDATLIKIFDYAKDCFNATALLCMTQIVRDQR